VCDGNTAISYFAKTFTDQEMAEAPVVYGLLEKLHEIFKLKNPLQAVGAHK